MALMMTELDVGGMVDSVVDDVAQPNHGSDWHAFKDPSKKAGPKRLADASVVGLSLIHI